MTYSTIQPIGVGKVGITGRVNGASSAYPLSLIKSPSRFMFMIDTMGATSKSGYSISTEGDFIARVKPLTVEGTDLRHNHAVNALFADYSVKSMGWNEIQAGLKWWSTL